MAEAVAAALVAQALAACSPSTDPSPTPSASSSPSSSSGVILDMPALAGKHSRAGAIAFARFFIELADESYVRADPTQLRSLAMKSCKGRTLVAEQTDALRTRGLHNDERSMRITKSAWVGRAKGADVVDVGHNGSSSLSGQVGPAW